MEWTKLLKGTLRRSIAAFVFLWLLPGSIGGTELKPVRRVLIFYEVGTSYPGIRLIDDGIRAALGTAPYKLEVYREYLDTILFPDPADQQRFRDFYFRKYQNRRPDVIIAVGPSPLVLMAETHRTAFPGVPIIYLNWAPSHPSLDSDFTGIENEFTSFETIEAALRLQPATRHIVVVGGTAFVDRWFLNGVKDQLKPYENNFDVSYLTDLTMPDLVERLKHLPGKTIVLFVAFSQDAAGTKFVSGDEASAKVAAAANCPVFILADTSLNHGEVGGKVASNREQGRLSGDMALRILKGEKPQEVPVANSPTVYMFDWRALKRWGLKDSKLPAGSIVLNRQPTFWELYKWYVIGGVSVILVQTFLILALLWQRARRRAVAAANRKLAAEALLNSEKLAAAGRLAATVAHEINNPLEGVINLLYLMRTDRNPTYLNMAEQEVMRIGHIVKQTLSYYRAIPNPVRVNVADIIDDVLAVFRGKIQSGEVKIERSFRHKDQIDTFPNELSQVFGNLIGNALDAMSRGGTLHLRTVECSRRIRVTIADNGCGIPQENLGNVFQPFFTANKEVGTGLGLWLAREIVQKHGGMIRVKSSTHPSRHGTVFMIWLPRNVPAAQEAFAS
jgi:signal transduction histidine kinase